MQQSPAKFPPFAGCGMEGQGATSSATDAGSIHFALPALARPTPNWATRASGRAQAPVRSQQTVHILRHQKMASKSSSLGIQSDLVVTTLDTVTCRLYVINLQRTGSKLAAHCCADPEGHPGYKVASASSHQS